eukprot:scaffold35600_cov19-Tisochrysis_lutea.AAC.1
MQENQALDADVQPAPAQQQWLSSSPGCIVNANRKAAVTGRRLIRMHTSFEWRHEGLHWNSVWASAGHPWLRRQFEQEQIDAARACIAQLRALSKWYGGGNLMDAPKHHLS